MDILGDQGSEVCSSPLIGSSEQMELLRRDIATAARFEEPVLIVGETGTGKDLVARSIHELGSRRHLTLAAMNCGAIQPDLLVSELFGHRRGAFTGAASSRKGKVLAADGSTLFLDEVSETTPEFQVALLRLLDTGEVQPVGSDGPPTLVNTRFVAASNRPFDSLQSGEHLRQDLYYRLSDLLILVPPLRERQADIPELAAHFVRQLNLKYDQEWSLTGCAVALLKEQRYPGNVRELRQVVFSACVATDGDEVSGLSVSSALAARQGRPRGIEGESLALRSVVRQRIEEAILTAGGNLAGAAELLEVPRSTLQHMVARNGIDLSRLREAAT